MYAILNVFFIKTLFLFYIVPTILNYIQYFVLKIVPLSTSNIEYSFSFLGIIIVYIKKGIDKT